MRSIGLFLFVLLFSFSSISQEKVRLGKSFGPVSVDTSKAISVKQMMKMLDGKTDKMEFTLRSQIQQVCATAGCWISLDKGNGQLLMVRFKDHFTIPPKTKRGTEAFVHGYAFMETVSVEMLRHLAEDAGKSPEEIQKINAPETRLGFQADGIVLARD
jgi:hypothetical protein